MNKMDFAALEVPLGATFEESGNCHFLVWAPNVQTAKIRFAAPCERTVPLKKDHQGYHHAVVSDVKPSSRYFFELDGRMDRPDPASRLQPEGVHGPSGVIEGDFPWTDENWYGLPLTDFILYEMHVGTFTPEGTFDAVIGHLDNLKNLGITALELMPVAQFPGERNWGYDGVYPFAVQGSYGGPQGLKRLVDACHQRGMAVVLDVVYNHLGPEGNYLADFGPYFTDRYQTPWGRAVNFDGRHSDHVRRFFIENALYWITECHIDALRIDAVHAIVDVSARTFLEELALAVQARAEALNRRIYLIAENDRNDPRLIRPRHLGGIELDAQWNDDFHHALHALLTGEQKGYYQDFGRLKQLAKAFREGFVYSGGYSRFRGRRHGDSSLDIPARRFVVFSQNHDQVGNRMKGERLSALVSFEGLKLAAGSVLLSPFVPLLFMGEEYGETAPFPYFVSHSDEALIETVRNGRRLEFAGFQEEDRPPDPQDETTFFAARLNHQLRTLKAHDILYAFYKALIGIRCSVSAIAARSKENLRVTCREDNILILKRWMTGWCHTNEAVVLFNFHRMQVSSELTLTAGRWEKHLDSADKCWNGPGSLMPETFSAGGEVTLSLQPQSFMLLMHRSHV